MAYVCIFILSVLFFTENALGYEWFGCKYNDSNFNIRSEDPGEIQTIPDWGGEISTVQFTKKDFTEFRDEINAMSKKILQDNNYNSLDDLLQFYTAFTQFRQHEGKNLTQFYRQYKMPNRLSGEEVGFIIKLVDEMAKKYGQVANKVFLSTCSSSVHPDLIDQFNQNQLSNKLPKNFNHDHVAAIIKISVDGSDGYVYLNPLMNFKNIVVIMNEKSNKLDRRTVEDRSGHMFIFRTDKSGQYINILYGRGKNQLCYIAEPYCSFVETTVKPNIIRPFHLITAHDNSGEPKASLKVNLYENQMQIYEYIKVVLPNAPKADSGFQWIDLELPFDEYSKNQETYKTLADYLGFNETEMKDKIDTLYRINKDRKKFIHELMNIDEWYNKLHRTRSKQKTTSS